MNCDGNSTIDRYSPVDYRRGSETEPVGQANRECSSTDNQRRRPHFHPGMEEVSAGVNAGV
jgi:hypothetical protein